MLVLAVGALSLLEATRAIAEDSNETTLQSETGRELRWSSTILGQFSVIDSPFDEDGIGGFFDQYEFAPNKSRSAPFELGVREISFDWIEDRAPLLQLRYESPSSNLGLSGSDFDDAFLNQRALLLGRVGAFRLEFDYRRLRTEQLRVFPETQAGGGALPFTDLTGRNNRFHRERTGFQSALRWRLHESLGDRSEMIGWLAPELMLRGGYGTRDTQRQLRTILNPGNDWLSRSDKSGDEVGDIGAGLLVAPGGLLTMTFDFDYQDFSSDNARLDSGLPFASTSRSVGFIPSSERKTGQVTLHSRIGDRAVVTAGFQATLLEQNGPHTPAQNSARFDSNEISVYSAQLSGDLQVVRDVSANAFFKFVYRDRDIDQSTRLFNPSNGTQVDELLDSYRRIDVGAETRYRPHRAMKLALGARLLWIERDLDFAARGIGNRAIQRANALVDETSLMWTLYGRADLRPVRGLGIRTELSFRDAPDTGYVTDLDGYFRGKLRTNYVLPVARPATLSLFASGGTGDNSDFSMVAGLGPTPPGPSIKRDYERWHWTVGFTGDLVLRDDLTVFSSLFYSQDQQSDDLQLSNVQRYFQESVAISFRAPGSLDFQSEELGIVLGAQVGLSEQTDAGLSYSLTRAEANYGESGSARELNLIDDNRIVDAEIHALDVEVRHQIRPGLRVFVGYRFQHYSDGAPKASSPSLSRPPPSRSDIRHIVGFGVTLNSELLGTRR